MAIISAGVFLTLMLDLTMMHGAIKPLPSPYNHTEVYIRTVMAFIQCFLIQVVCFFSLLLFFPSYLQKLA